MVEGGEVLRQASEARLSACPELKTGGFVAFAAVILRCFLLFLYCCKTLVRSLAIPSPLLLTINSSSSTPRR